MRRELGVFPLPAGERARVRGFEPIDRAYPLTPPLSPWEREPTEFAARLPYQRTSAQASTSFWRIQALAAFWVRARPQTRAIVIGSRSNGMGER
jgi:hypothetical protein